MHWYAALILSLLPSVAFAAGNDFNLLQASLQMLAALGIVLGVLLLLVAIVRKRKLLPFGQAREGLIQVIETRHLGPRKALCLVQVQGENLLLSVCQDRIELLARPGGKNAPEFSSTLVSALEKQR